MNPIHETHRNDEISEPKKSTDPPCLVRSLRWTGTGCSVGVGYEIGRPLPQLYIQNEYIVAWTIQNCALGLGGNAYLE